MTTIILKGKEGYFSFGDGAFGGRSLPAGAYDFAVGLMQNQKREKWLLRPGERSSFTLPANEMVIPPWGAPLKAVMDLNSTGREVVVSPPRYFGVADEEYVPLSRDVFLERVYAHRIRKDGRTSQLNLEVKLPLGSPKTFPLLDDGSLTSISFEVNSTEMLEFTLENKSGLMGVIRNSERLSFVHRRTP
jgi:hypothetical protein